MPIFKTKGAKVSPTSSREKLLNSESIAFAKSPLKKEYSSEPEHLCPSETSCHLTPNSVDSGLQNSWVKCGSTENFAAEKELFEKLAENSRNRKKLFQSRSPSDALPSIDATTTIHCPESKHCKPVGRQKSIEASRKKNSLFAGYQTARAEEQCTSRETIKTNADIETQIAQRDIVALKCRWFPDVDNLHSLKLKYSSNSIQGAESKKEIHEWLSEPKNFYRCIQTQRQQKANFKEKYLDHKTTDLKIVKKSKQSLEKHVCFSSEVLLLLAIEDNSTRQLKELILSNNVDINKTINHKDFSVLHRAVELGHSNCVRILLLHGANVDAKDSLGRSPIDIALSTKHFECMVLLIEYGANIAEFTNRKLQEFRNVTEFSKTSCKLFELDI